MVSTITGAAPATTAGTLVATCAQAGAYGAAVAKAAARTAETRRRAFTRISEKGPVKGRRQCRMERQAELSPARPSRWEPVVPPQKRARNVRRMVFFPVDFVY